MTTLVVSTVAAWAMVGLIWTVQVVHYPMLAAYSELRPREAAIEHQRRISWIVGPLMAAEGVTALLLLADRPVAMSAFSAWAAAALLALALGSTVLVQVPLHRRLAQGGDRRAAERLITTNWVRTVAWTGRGMVLAWVLAT
ncbi:MAG: hypothetical protein O3C27_01555 [Actinomycetota bacterium]|nr:hypothetical protein [Actinomycetota bacterium]